MSSPVQFVLLYDLLSSCFGSNVLFSPPFLPSLIITSSFTVTLLLPLYLCCSYLSPPVFLPPSSVYFLNLFSLDWYPTFYPLTFLLPAFFLLCFLPFAITFLHIFLDDEALYLLSVWLADDSYSTSCACLNNNTFSPLSVHLSLLPLIFSPRHLFDNNSSNLLLCVCVENDISGHNSSLIKIDLNTSIKGQQPPLDLQGL